MGDYTPTQKFYLIDGEELVNVEQDLNYNWRRADTKIRALVDFQNTDVPTLATSDLPKDEGYKWFKTYTNSIYHYTDGSIITSANSAVTDWAISGISFEPGYGSANLEDSRIAYAVQDGFVHLRGRLVLNSGSSELPANVTTNFMTLPNSVMPLRNKYFTVYGGNSTGTDFQCARIYVPEKTLSDQRIEFCKYGGNASSSSERYLSLNDVYWGLDD